MKRPNKTVVRPVAEEASTVRILKRATCPSVSGKSTLCFEVGVDEKVKALQLRVVSNSGRGCFSQAWVKVDAIRAHLDKAAKGENVTSHVLAPLFRGVSQNTAGFVWAVLVHTGFVTPSTVKKRAYDRAEPTAFLEEIAALADGRKPTDVKAKRAKSATETHPEKPSAATKKKKAKS
jgi:hypothetical protein